MTHPLERLDAPRRALFFRWFIFATLAIMAGLQTQGRPLRTEAAPAGIVSYEFACSEANARTMIESWPSLGPAYGNLLLDFPFLVAYSTSIALGCLWAGSRMNARDSRLGRLGPWLAWGQWLAAGLDAIENAALIITLVQFGAGAALAPWPSVAAVCAAPKFLLVALGLAYSALGLFARPGRDTGGQGG
jgi:hypothetical protein